MKKLNCKVQITMIYIELILQTYWNQNTLLKLRQFITVNARWHRNRLAEPN